MSNVEDTKRQKGALCLYMTRGRLSNRIDILGRPFVPQFGMQGDGHCDMVLVGERSWPGMLQGQEIGHCCVAVKAPTKSTLLELRVRICSPY